MNMKKLLPVILALGLGGIAAKLVRDRIVRSKPQVVQVVTIHATAASTDLLADQEIRAENVKVITVTPSKDGPNDFILNPAELVGRVVSGPIRTGTPILQSNLRPKGAIPHVSVLIPAGMRAMTIPVDEMNSVSGMLIPGSRVDLITTYGQGKDFTTQTLLKNILVQAVGQRLVSGKTEDGKEPPPFRTITIIVTPREAELVELAGSTSRIRLTLRPLIRNLQDEGDPGKVRVADIDGKDHHDDETIVAVHPAVPVTAQDPVTHRTVVLIRGNMTQKVIFDIPRAADVSTGDQLKPVVPEEDSERREP